MKIIYDRNQLGKIMVNKLLGMQIVAFLDDFSRDIGLGELWN